MKRNNIFWISFADLMTSLFFVMLVLFVLSKKENDRLVTELKNIIKISNQERKKVEEIDSALKNIDPKNFSYNEEFKKHVLNIELIDKNGNTGFPRGSFDINDLNLDTKNKLRDAGNNLINKMKILSLRNVDIQYLIVLEGQASRDFWIGNDELSYKRAISLRDFWFKSQDQNAHMFVLDSLPNCEVVIAGSGQYGLPRDHPDQPPNNQRFLVTIIPKYGEIGKGN